MAEMFIGTVKASERGVNVTGTVRLVKENECIFETVSDNKIKCILSNSDVVSKGDELMLVEKEANVPAPKFEVFKFLKK